MKVEYTSEFMLNQKHATVMSPDKEFKVLQTKNGSSLFFSVGTDNILYCTREVQGSSQGWNRTDLISILSQQFENKKVTAKCFDVFQNPIENGAIDIVVGVHVGDEDYLFIASDIPNEAEKWSSPPEWKLMPYDDESRPLSSLVIENVYMAISDSKEYIAVDILKNPSDPLKIMNRYFIDPTKKLTGIYWNYHPLAIDLEAGKFQSALGRKSKQYVDGIYTLGSITGMPEMVYTPLYNAFDPAVAPNPTRFTMPDGAKADTTSFAVSHNKKGETDLILATNGALYFLSSDKQSDKSTFTKVYSDKLLKNVQSIHVNNDSESVLVWGVNDEGQVFYLKNELGKETSNPWTKPIPLLRNVVKVASYINTVHKNTIIFAETSETSNTNLIRLTQNPTTSLWSQHNILLPSTDINDVHECKTYTTHIQVSRENNLLPSKPLNISLCTSTPLTVVVNNEYHNLIEEPIKLKTDNTGRVTIIQDVTTLNAAIYTFQLEDGDPIIINPMNNVMDGLSKIKKGSDLDKKVKNEQGNEVPIVGPHITSKQKDETADALQKLLKTTQSLPVNGSKKALSSKSKAEFDTKNGVLFGASFRNGKTEYFNGLEQAKQHGISFDNGVLNLELPNGTIAPLDNFISSLAGDVFNWIENAFDEIEHFFINITDDISHFFITIAGEVFHFILDCVDLVVRGIEFVLKKLAEILIDILLFLLGFLFDWKDIIRTHKVMKNLIYRFAEHNINEMDKAKDEIEKLFKNIEHDINKWAGLPPISDSVSSISAASPPRPGQNSAQANWGKYHMNNNMNNSSGNFSPPTHSGGSFVDKLIKLFKKEEKVFEDAIEELKMLAKDAENLPLTDIIKRFVAILADALLETVKNALLIFVDAVQEILSTVLEILTAKIEIPILSWIYKKITDDDLTMLDLLCLVAAIPADIINKLSTGNELFPDDKYTHDLINAQDFEQIKTLLNSPPTLTVGGSDQSGGGFEALYIMGAVGSFFELFVNGIAYKEESYRVYVNDNKKATNGGKGILTVTTIMYIMPVIPGVISPSNNGWGTANMVVNVLSGLNWIMSQCNDSDKTDQGWGKNVAPILSVPLGIGSFITAIGTYATTDSPNSVDKCNLASGIFYGLDSALIGAAVKTQGDPGAVMLGVAEVCVLGNLITNSVAASKM